MENVECEVEIFHEVMMSGWYTETCINLHVLIVCTGMRRIKMPITKNFGFQDFCSRFRLSYTICLSCSVSSLFSNNLDRKSELW